MKSKHDKIATRISLILTKLNNGEKLSIQKLVDEFGVSKRTIQRDLNEGLPNIPINLSSHIKYGNKTREKLSRFRTNKISIC